MSEVDYSGVREGGRSLAVAGGTLAVAAILFAVFAYVALGIYLGLALNNNFH